MSTDALAYLFGLETIGIKFGLENISKLCGALDYPERSFQSIIVGGTNGKGSVTAMVHRALIAAGHRAARYTSPHLERLEERFVICAREVETTELRTAAEIVRMAIDGLLRSGAIERPPTFFEAATAIAFVLFRRAGVEAAVLEVGLGGRLDATNVVTPIAAAITSIDFDHEALLGSSLESIAFEKAGIIKPGIPVVCGPLPPEAESVIRRVCEEQHARFIRATDHPCAPEARTVALPGSHQVDNARVAACLLREIDGLGLAVDEQAIGLGVSDVAWPGRLERFRVIGGEVLLDAAHNPAGARALARYLREIGWSGCALVFGAMQDKNVESMLLELAPVCGEIVCTTPSTPRALDAKVAATRARSLEGAAWTVTVRADPRDALAYAVGRHARVVVAGSIFLIGPVRGILRAP